MLPNIAKYLVCIASLCFTGVELTVAKAESPKDGIYPLTLYEMLPVVQCDGLKLNYASIDGSGEEVETTPPSDGCAKAIVKLQASRFGFWPAPKASENFEAYYLRLSQLARNLCVELGAFTPRPAETMNIHGCTFTPTRKMELPDLILRNLDFLRATVKLGSASRCFGLPGTSVKSIGSSLPVSEIAAFFGANPSDERTLRVLLQQGFSRTMNAGKSYEWRLWIVEFDDQRTETAFMPPIVMRFSFEKVQFEPEVEACTRNPVSDECKRMKIFQKPRSIDSLCLSIEGFGH